MRLQCEINVSSCFAVPDPAAIARFLLKQSSIRGRGKGCMGPVKAKTDFRSFGLIGGVAITISGRGSIPIRVRRPIRIGVTVVGSCGYRGPEQAKSDAETNGGSDSPTTTMMVPTTAPTAIGK